MTDETSPSKGFWSKVADAFAAPGQAFSSATKHSPYMTFFAVLLVVQPVIQTGVELVREWTEVRQDLDPETRPVTKAELDIVNQKIDFNNELILSGIRAEVQRNGVDKPHASPDSKDYSKLQDHLTSVQKKLDDAYKVRKK